MRIRSLAGKTVSEAVAQDPLFVALLRQTQARRDEAYTDKGGKKTAKGSVFKEAADRLKEARDEKERLDVLQRMRAAEARAFHSNQMVNMEYTLAKGWIGGPVETAFWRTVRALANVLPMRPQAHRAVHGQRLGTPLAAC